MIMPRNPHTNIVDSELSSETKTYCSHGYRCNDTMQGQLPQDFWRNVDFQNGTRPNGARFAQRKSCFLLSSYLLS